MDLKKNTIDEAETIKKNWKNGIAPSICIGKCKLIEGGGELKCIGCGWIDCELINN